MAGTVESSALQAAGEHLLTELGDLVERITAEIWQRVPAYSEILSDRSALEQYVLPNITDAVEFMRSGRDIDDADRERLDGLGRSRALQGVPQAAMIQSFRIGERALIDAFCVFCIWGGFNSAEQRRGIQAISAIMDRVEQATLAAYLETQRQLEDDRNTSVAVLVARLVDGGAGDRQEIDAQARLIGANPSVRYRCVALAVLPTESDDPTAALARLRRHIQSRLIEARMPAYIGGIRDHALVLLVPVADRDALPAIQRAVSQQSRLDAVGGAGDVYDSLFEARASCQQALAALQVALRQRRHHEVVTYDDVIVDVMLLESGDASRRLIDTYLGNLSDHPPLIETVREYIRQSLAPQATADQLMVHVNTVAYRLRRVRELTGHDVRNPTESIGFSLALRARDLLG